MEPFLAGLRLVVDLVSFLTPVTRGQEERAWPKTPQTRHRCAAAAFRPISSLTMEDLPAQGAPATAILMIWWTSDGGGELAPLAAAAAEDERFSVERREAWKAASFWRELPRLPSGSQVSSAGPNPAHRT